MSQEINREYTVSHPDENPDALRERFQAEGYLFFPDYADAGRCAELLGQIVERSAPHISLRQGQPVLRGEPFFETDPTWDEVYPRIQALEAFHGFFHDAQIQQLMRLVSGGEVFVYPMKMARIATPGKVGYETPPHQDAHSHHAGPTMAGIWVALHDVDDSMGRVKVLPGSHRGGVRPVHSTQGVGGVQCEIYAGEDTWHVSDYRRGDVLIFHSATVHKAEPNTSREKVRISVDTRFCDYGAPVFCTNLEPHHGWRIDGLDWESVYLDWRDTAPRYYWRDYPNLF